MLSFAIHHYLNKSNLKVIHNQLHKKNLPGLTNTSVVLGSMRTCMCSISVKYTMLLKQFSTKKEKIIHTICFVAHCSAQSLHHNFLVSIALILAVLSVARSTSLIFQFEKFQTINEVRIKKVGNITIICSQLESRTPKCLTYEQILQNTCEIIRVHYELHIIRAFIESE